MSDFYYLVKLNDAILATLAYYDGLDYPLSVYEAYRYLVNPQRLQPHLESIDAIALADVQATIDELKAKGAIIEELGFYSLKERTGLSQLRIEREKLTAQKWRSCLNKAYWLQCSPWIRGMFVSGSLALGTVSAESDFDILVLVEPGRLYLARLFLSGVASLIGARRTRFETSAPNKFCFNHYVTTDTLTIRHESLYNAQTYAHLVPMNISQHLAGEFFAANLWINKFVYNFTPHLETIRRTVRPSVFLRGVARTIEFVCGGFIGNALEKLAKKYQQERIAKNPATHAAGGRVIATDYELEFHPRSFERIVLERYNQTTSRLGVSVIPELDSGLRQ